MTSVAASKISMIIDGIAASEAIDSSGEILDVKGCDISDFENGVGVLNYEHRGDDANGASGNDIVGKIIYAKKIFKKEECEDKRQEAYWDSVKLPFIYIRARLYDGAGHAGAKALAAIIRDAVMHKEPILARFSIEGSTLKKEGQRLAKTLARKVAVTLKPANKSAISGLVSDPNAPKPISEKQADKSLLDQILESAPTLKSELGGHTMMYPSLAVDEDPAVMVKMAIESIQALSKTMTGGMPSGAPSTLTGGAALQREDDRLHRNKERVKNDLRAAVRDLPDSARVSKESMLKFFKFRLPEVNPQFLEHFTDLIDDVRTRQVGDWVEKTMKVWDAVQKTEARVREEFELEKASNYSGWHAPNLDEEHGEFERVSGELGIPMEHLMGAAKQAKLEPLDPKMLNDGSLDNYSGTSGLNIKGAARAANEYGRDWKRIAHGFKSGAPMPAPIILHREGQKPHLMAGNTRTMVAHAMGAPVQALHIRLGKNEDETKTINYTPRPEAANPATVPQGARGGPGLSEEGQILSNKLTAKGQKLELYPFDKDELYNSIINADRQGSNLLDDNARNEIIKKVHTPWKRAVGNWMALNKLAKAGALPASVVAQAAIFSAMSPNTGVPMQELYYGHYQDFTDKYGPIFTNPTGINPSDAEQFHHWLNRTTPPEFFQKYYLGNAKESGRVGFDVERSSKLKGDASLEKRPQGAPLLNYHRFHPTMVALHRETKDDGRAFVDYIMQEKEANGADAMMKGFGPKLARYMALMMGAGNVIVPDRHFMRALFNLDAEDPRNDYVLSILAPVKGERLLRGLDHHYAQNAPTVKKVLNMYPEHFKDNEMQAVGPGFWLQWLAMPHYNRLRGQNVQNLNEGSAHDPYFKAVADILNKERIPHDLSDVSELYKSELPFSLPARVARATKAIQDQFGENEAAFFFYSHGVPALLMNEQFQGVDPTIMRKMEELSVELSILFKNDNPMPKPAAPWPPQDVPEMNFQGLPVKPGAATIYSTLNGQHVPEGRKMAILGKVPASPKSPQGEWLMVPHEKLGMHGPDDLERWPIDAPHAIHKEPTFTQVQPGVVHASIHVPEHFVINDNQRKLVHGLNMREAAGDTPPHVGESFGSETTWHKLPTGKLGIVKTDLYSGRNDHTSEMPSDSHNEVLYHNVMHHLGLGKYVPPTALVQDPDAPINRALNKEHWHSVQEMVPNAQHFDKNSDKHAKILHELNRTGELQKLALANQLLGNKDRHDFNYLFGGKNGDELYMIDHGMSFPDYTRAVAPYPSYMAAAMRHGDSKLTAGEYPDHHRLHPEAKKWLESLDPSSLEQYLNKHQVPKSISHVVVSKLKHMKDYVKQEPKANFDEVWSYPNAALNTDEYPEITRSRFNNAVGERRAIEPGLIGRHKARLAALDAKRLGSLHQEGDRQKIISDVANHYIKGLRSGGTKAPMDILKELHGDKAHDMIRPPYAPNDPEEHAKRFNRDVLRNTSFAIKQAQDLAKQIGHNMAVMRKNGLDPIHALDSLESDQLDTLSQQIHGPERIPGASDVTFRQQLLQFLTPHIDRARLGR